MKHCSPKFQQPNFKKVSPHLIKAHILIEIVFVIQNK